MSDRNLLRVSSLKKPGGSRKNRHVLIRVPESDQDEPMKRKTKLTIAGLLVLMLLSAISGVIIGGSEYRAGLNRQPPDPEEAPPPSPSWLHKFQKAAVCTDAPHCSDIGRHVLSVNGSAVDAAIAAMFCNGILNQQSMGIGGGFFMTVFIKAEEKVYAVNAREKAPSAATEDMFHGDDSMASRGGLAVGVPGEVRGMWAAHKKWGKLPWKSLVAPTLEFCNYGFPISNVLYNGLESAPYVVNDPLLSKVYATRGRFHTPGTVVKPSKQLCKTLRIIAERGGDELYNGSLATSLVEDLKTAGSIITAKDLRNYQAEITDAIAFPLPGGDTLHTPPPPSSGAVLGLIMNILQGYQIDANSVTPENAGLTFHRIIESFKFAYAVRTQLGDVDYLNITELLKNVTLPAFGEAIRRSINDAATSNRSQAYGADTYNKGDGGTAHISIIAPNGDAVSVTSSINYYYGAGFTTYSTGIIMNNVMDDFSSPGIINYFGVQPSRANFIEPNKRPLSSMSPSIIVDKNGNAKVVIGASGGTKIPTATALVLIRKLWFGQTIKEAVDAARVHHQLFPMVIRYEYGVLKHIVQGLRARGHGMLRYTERGSIVCALFRNSTGIYANADYRKGGDVAGID